MSSPPRSTPTDRRAVLAGGLALAFAGCGGTPARRDGSRASDGRAADRELFRHLADQGGSVAPISPAEHADRRARLAARLRALGADALVMEPGATMTWLSGVAWGRSERLFALAVLADGAHAFCYPAFEAARAEERVAGAGASSSLGIAWEEHEYGTPALCAFLRERRAGRVLIEPALRHRFAAALSRELGSENVESGAALVAELRAVKDEHEIALLARANELTQLAIAEVAQTLEPGLDGAAIGARMDAAHAALGLRAPWNLALIGPAAALPHGESTPRRLERGDVLLVDTGGALHGYQSDITRTWVFGAAPTLEVERAWHDVRDAQSAALDAIEVGVEARAIDARARAFLATRGRDGGYREFTHRLGHGIGLEGHEDPYFDGGDRTLLASGMTLSVEPGLYFPSRFGARIEDIVAVTGTGARVFGRRQASARSPA